MGNRELQACTCSRANCHLDGHGHLVITALRTGGGFHVCAADWSAGEVSVSVDGRSPGG